MRGSKFVGIHQVGNKVIKHYQRDIRPVAASIAWIVIVTAVIVTTSFNR